MPETVTFYADDCQTPVLGCLSCHEVAPCDFGMATPVRMYRLALSCPECGEQFVDWELGNWRVA